MESELIHTIRGLEAKRIEAMVNKDLATLGDLLADDLSYTHSGGVTETKAQFITLIRDREPKHRYLGVDFASADVMPMPGGTAAMVRGRATIRLDGTAPYAVLFLDVWALRSGTWQLVAWQATRVP
jgi:hypothetical protein